MSKAGLFLVFVSLSVIIYLKNKYVSKCFKSNNLFNSNYLSIKLFLLYKLLKITVSVFTFFVLLGAVLGAGVVNYVNILIPSTWRYLTCFCP